MSKNLKLPIVSRLLWIFDFLTKFQILDLILGWQISHFSDFCGFWRFLDQFLNKYSQIPDFFPIDCRFFQIPYFLTKKKSQIPDYFLIFCLANSRLFPDILKISQIPVFYDFFLSRLWQIPDFLIINHKFPTFSRLIVFFFFFFRILHYLTKKKHKLPNFYYSADSRLFPDYFSGLSSGHSIFSIFCGFWGMFDFLTKKTKILDFFSRFFFDFFLYCLI